MVTGTQGTVSTVTNQGRETVTILRRAYDAMEDPYGNEVPTLTEIPITGVLIAWGATADIATLYQEGNKTLATLYLPNGTLTKNDDRFILPDGNTWVKEGATIDWVPQVGSPIRAKVIVQVRLNQG